MRETCYMCGIELTKDNVIFDGDGLACKGCIEESKRLIETGEMAKPIRMC